jgi:DNA-binding CsgD family transcriptional regulator
VNSGVVGRDGEIAELCALLSAASRAPTALAITGDAGIGKTAVWQHVLQSAGQSSHVLSCQPTPAERPLAFSALDDLFGAAAADILPALAGPRKRAVEVALLQDASPEPPPAAGLPRGGRPPPERRVLARGILDGLQILSGHSKVVIGIDDAHLLDLPSAAVLEFCFRRLRDEPVTILLTLRSDAAFPLGLDRTLPPDRLRRVPLGPLSLGAIGEMLRTRLGVTLPRYAMTRLYDACGGNPFYALEYGRTFAGRPQLPRTNEPIAVPPSLRDLLRHRVRRLSPAARRVGWLVATSSDPRERLIRAACDQRESWAAIDQAIDDGIIERDGDVLRFTHPLLRSVLYGEMPRNERRKAHRQLAETAEDTEDHAWHLALGADRPADEIAEVLIHAAEHAASRGAPEEAASLAEQAVRLTLAGQPDTVRERSVRAADYHFRAGDIDRSRELIQSALTDCPTGPAKASLLIRLATIYYHQNGWPLAEQTFRQAADEAAGDPALRAHAEQELAFARMVAGDLPAASRWAKASLQSADQAADPRLTAHSLARIALFEFLQGNGVQLDLLDKATALDAAAGEEPVGRLPMLDPSLVTGLVLKWCDRLDEARLRLAARYRLALDRGDEASLPFLLYHFSQLECWTGNWDAAEEYALEACRVADESRQEPMRPAALYSLALVRAHRGQVQDARQLADETLALCTRTGNVPIRSVTTSVLGFLALSLDDYQTVHAHLGRLADTSAAVGLGEPSVVKFLPDEVEALIALGEIDLARSFTQQLEARGKALGRRWALATSARCRAQLAAACGDLPQALIACDQALSYQEQLPMPFELGRTLLVKGSIERRARHRPTARTSLGHALDIFERLGALLWADKARRELAGITAGRPVDGLTDAEGSIAILIARGQTNREIASALFVTQNTVQTHVRHIFQKLGVRSRTQLAARLLSPTAAQPSAQSKPR